MQRWGCRGTTGLPALPSLPMELWRHSLQFTPPLPPPSKLPTRWSDVLHIHNHGFSNEYNLLSLEWAATRGKHYFVFLVQSLSIFYPKLLLPSSLPYPELPNGTPGAQISSNCQDRQQEVRSLLPPPPAMCSMVSVPLACLLPGSRYQAFKGMSARDGRKMSVWECECARACVWNSARGISPMSF